MTLEPVPDKLSIKQLLFTKAIPNYVIPVPTDGYKVYSCTDCGDKFIFKSSLDHHVKRKSVQIEYMCRHCSQPRVFFNRCNLLSHIRSHAFKSATINVTDLSIQPLPLDQYKIQLPSDSSKSLLVKRKLICNECKEVITGPGPLYKDRGRHFMQYTNEVYTCPVCLFAMPTECGLKVHMRIHFKCPPYYCPECGSHIPNQCVNYPYNHDCEGFRMMRATSRLKCQMSSCPPFHPSELKDHMKKKHSKKVFKCPFCVVACFNEATMKVHLNNHKVNCKPLIFYQCDICPGRLVLQNQMENHSRRHLTINVFPCWTCAVTFKDVRSLIEHCVTKHEEIGRAIKNWFNKSVELLNTPDKSKKNYRVVKKCDQCQRSFTYKCKYTEIMNLPNECPYKCSPNSSYTIIPVTEANEDEVTSEENPNTTDILCHLCETHISQNWEDIKKHFAEKHNNIKCLDVKLSLPKIDINKYITSIKKKKVRPTGIVFRRVTKRGKKRGKSSKKYVDVTKTVSSINSVANKKEDFVCNICEEKCSDKQSLEKHMIDHRDPCMAYQCLECGESFVVKPSFSTHLLLVHQITDPDEYISSKDCYNENALAVNQQDEPVNEEPLCENQCNICREQFDNSEDLKKHFRVHGMAFLLKSTSNQSNNSIV